jgi:hypothetical protein
MAGGCQQIVEANSEVVFAYAHNSTPEHPTPIVLKLSGPPTGTPNTDVTLKVTDAVANIIKAVVDIYQTNSGTPTLFGRTDANGQFVHRYPAGTYELKADKVDDFFTI